MGEEAKEVTFEKLEDAIQFVEDKGKAAEGALKGFHTAFRGRTGYSPADRLTALDAVKIFNRLAEKS